LKIKHNRNLAGVEEGNVEADGLGTVLLVVRVAAKGLLLGILLL
jgi:hypothetical protein